MLVPETTLEGPKRQPVQPERPGPETIALELKRQPEAPLMPQLVMIVEEPGRPGPVMTAVGLERLVPETIVEGQKKRPGGLEKPGPGMPVLGMTAEGQKRLVLVSSVA